MFTPPSTPCGCRALPLAATLAFALPLGAHAATITVAAHYSQEQIAPLSACFARFTEETGHEVEYQQISYRDYLQTVLTARISGQSPDVYSLYSIWGAQMIPAGVLMPAPEATAQFVRDNYAESAIEAASFDGELYGIPAELSAYLMVYNKNLLAEAGYDTPPATWDEVLAAGEAITQESGGEINTAGFVFGRTVAERVHPFFAQLYSVGIDPFKEDLSGTNLTAPEAIEVLRQQSAIYRNNIASRALRIEDFLSGAVGMMIMANWYEATLRGAFADDFADTVGVASIPMGEDWRTLQYTFYWGVDANSDVSDEAWQLLEFLNTAQDGAPSCTGQMLLELGALTANLNDIEAGSAQLGDAFTQPYVEAVTSGKALSEPNVPQAAEIEAILAGYIEQAWTGAMSPEDALSAADREIGAILLESQY